MHEPPSITALEHLVAALNVAFGHRLLFDSHAEGDEVPFEEFVRVAEELVGESPQSVAMHLAGLIALDLHAASMRELERRRATLN